MSDILPLTALSGIFLSVIIGSFRAELKLRPYVIPLITPHIQTDAPPVISWREEKGGDGPADWS
jgi:hypothetical protein